MSGKTSEIVLIAMIKKRVEMSDEVSDTIYSLKYIMSSKDLDTHIGLVIFINNDSILEKWKGCKCNCKSTKVILEIELV